MVLERLSSWGVFLKCVNYIDFSDVVCLRAGSNLKLDSIKFMEAGKKARIKALLEF